MYVAVSALYPLLFPGKLALSLCRSLHLSGAFGIPKVLQVAISVVMFAWHSTDPALPIVIKSSR